MQPADTPEPNNGNKEIMESIAPAGDIVLVVGTESRRVLVLSTVLKTSSKVFASLLGPKFLEGQGSASSQQPKEIALPDDDPTAMSDMCHLLHNNQVEDLIVCPSTDRILAFAVVVDKYDCVNALRLQIQGVLLGYPALREDLCFDDCVKNLLASCLLKHSWTFKLLCGRVIARSTKPFMSILDAEWAKPFPSNLIYALENKRSAVQQRIAFELPVVGITPCIYKCSTSHMNHTGTHQRAFNIPFWPPNFTPRGSCTLSEAFEIIKNTDHVNLTGCCSHNSYNKIQVKSLTFKKFANELKEDCEKLCLQCILAGKMDFKDPCEVQEHRADYKVMVGI